MTAAADATRHDDAPVDASWIVVVDDDAGDRALATRALAREFPGARITAVGTPAEWEPVLAQLRDQSQPGPAALVTDYRLRWSDGLAVLAEVRALRPDCPVVMFTNTGSEEIAVAAMKSGLDDYVIKHPETAPRLARAVRAAQERRAVAARAARAEGAAEAARTRAAQLQAVTAALASAATPVDVAQAAVHEGIMAIGAATGSLSAFPRDGTRGAHGEGEHLELLAAAGFDPSWISRQSRIPLDARMPHADAARDRLPIWLTGRDAVAVRYPQLATRTELGTAGLVVLPLLVSAKGGARVVGALGASFHEARMLDEDERAYFETLAGLAAQALQRAWLYEDEQVARREAEEANRAKTQFLATMSHELRTPLNAIQGHVQLMELGIHGDVTDAQRTALERVQRAQRHLLGLIDDILNYARLESGRVEFALAPTSLAEVVREVVPLMEPQLATRGLTLDATRATDARAEVVIAIADREKLVQVLLNLLSNAMKFTPAGGRVTLAVETSDESGTALARLRVRDTGAGIPADRLSAIFEPFVQVGRALNSPHEGTGLGLAISRDLARGMGGDITVESTVGEGSTFTVTLKQVPTV